MSKVRVNIMIDSDDLAMLDALAHTHLRSRSAQIAAMVREANGEGAPVKRFNGPEGEDVAQPEDDNLDELLAGLED